MDKGMRYMFFALTAAFGLLSGYGGAAQAQSAPYACNGTPGEQMVGTTQSGGATVPLCVAGSGTLAMAPLVDYAGIAWHADYDEVWFGGGWGERGRADPEVLALCNRQTGGGCRAIGEYSNSYVAIAKASDGSLHYGWAQVAKAARRNAVDNCVKARGPALQPLPCMELGSYSALDRRYRAPKDLQAARKRYGAGARISGGKADEHRAWFATGHRSRQDAADAALRACRQAHPGNACEIFVAGGNVVIQAYRQSGLSGAGTADRALTETTAKRATQAAKAACNTARARCVMQSQFDTRVTGLFAHDFKTGGAARK